MEQAQIENFERDLREHHAACQEALSLAEERNSVLREDSPMEWESFIARQKKMLAQLASSLANIKANRTRWVALSATVKSAHPQILELLRQSQDLVMRVVFFDRENERLMLRKGLVPASHVSSVGSKSAHYVAGVYQRHAAGRLAINAD